LAPEIVVIHVTGQLVIVADIVAAPVAALVLAAVGVPETVAFHMTGQLVIAAGIVAVSVAALVLAAVGAPEIVVFPVAMEGQPAADTADSGLGLDTEGSKIYSADMQVYRCC
jgi:hypothetical protein